MKDVAAWYEANVENKKKLPGYNSFVAHKPHEEYQVDLMWITDKVIPKTVIKQHQQPNTKDEKGKKVTGKKLDVETTEYDPLPDSKKPLMVFCDVFTRRIWVIPLEGSKAAALIAACSRALYRWVGSQRSFIAIRREASRATRLRSGSLRTTLSPYSLGLMPPSWSGRLEPLRT